MAGGKRRVYAKGATVKDTREDRHQLRQTGKFYSLAKYKEKFGCPSITKAKIVKRRWNKKTIRGVVVVSETETGVFEHETISANATRKHRTTFDAEDALVDEDLHEAAEDALSDNSEDLPHTGPSGAHPFPLECAVGTSA